KELDQPGYDLVGVFVGSEGTLGVATRIVLRVVPVPEAFVTLVAYFETTDHAGAAVSDIVAAGIVPGAIEMMDRLTIRACEAATHAGYPLDAGAALIVELDGPDAECRAWRDDVGAICETRSAPRSWRRSSSTHASGWEARSPGSTGSASTRRRR